MSTVFSSGKQLGYVCRGVFRLSDSSFSASVFVDTAAILDVDEVRNDFQRITERLVGRISSVLRQCREEVRNIQKTVITIKCEVSRNEESLCVSIFVCSFYQNIFALRDCALPHSVRAYQLIRKYI